MIRDSGPELDRGSATPSASTRSTERPACAMRYAVHAPKTPQPMTATSQARSSIVKLDLHDVAVSQTVRVAKRDVGGDLDDRLGVTAEARVGTVRSQKKGLAPEDAAGHQVYVYRPTGFLFFQSQHMGGQRIRFIEAD